MLNRAAFCLAVALSLVAGISTARSESVLYMVERTSDALWTIDTTTGEATQVGPLGFDLDFIGMAYDPTSDTFLVSSGRTMQGFENRLYRVDPLTGAATIVGDTGVENMAGLTYDTNRGVLYGFTGFNDSLYEVDPNTAAATLIGSVGAEFNVSGLAFDPVNDLLYMTEINTDSLYTVNTSDASLTTIGATGVQNIIGLAYDPQTGQLLGSSGPNDSLLSLDPATGIATEIGPMGFDIINNGLAFRALAVPEPSFAVALGALSTVLVVRRRRR